MLIVDATPSVAHPKSGRVLGPGLPPVVEPGGADAGVPKPLLNEADVGLVLEGVGRGGRPKRMQAQPIDVHLGLSRIRLDHPINPIAGDRGIQDPSAVVPNGPSEGAFLVLSVALSLEVGRDGIQMADCAQDFIP